MARVLRWGNLSAEIRRNGLDLTTHQGQTIIAWLWKELDHKPPNGWEAALRVAVDQARRVYEDFMEVFEACFSELQAPGEGWVRNAVRHHLGWAPDLVVEAVLNRIRDRRFHLLCHCRERYQPV